jgi:hypothetical protein
MSGFGPRPSAEPTVSQYISAVSWKSFAPQRYALGRLRRPVSFLSSHPEAFPPRKAPLRSLRGLTVARLSPSPNQRSPRQVSLHCSLLLSTILRGGAAAPDRGTGNDFPGRLPASGFAGNYRDFWYNFWVSPALLRKIPLQSSGAENERLLTAAGRFLAVFL